MRKTKEGKYILHSFVFRVYSQKTAERFEINVKTFIPI